MTLNTKNKEKSFLYILCEKSSHKILKNNTIINSAGKGTSLEIQKVQFNSISLLIN